MGWHEVEMVGASLNDIFDSRLNQDANHGADQHKKSEYLTSYEDSGLILGGKFFSSYTQNSSQK